MAFDKTHVRARQQKILDNDNSKIDINAMEDNMADLSDFNRKQLKLTLRKIITLFGGGLGVLDIKPVTIELQKNATPFKGR